MMRLKWILVLGILLCFACSRETEDWKHAKLENSMGAYNEFVRQHPQSTFADSARFIIATKRNTIESYHEFLNSHPPAHLAESANSYVRNLYKERHPDLVDAKNLQIIVDAFYGKAKGINLPFDMLPKAIAKYAGLHVIDNDTGKIDLTMRIKIRGTALGARYESGNPKGEYLYSGAEISGSVSLEYFGKQYYKRAFHGKEPVWSVIHSYHPTPSSAPFGKAFEQSDYAPAVCKMFGELFGYHSVISTGQYHEDVNIRLKVIKSLKEIRPDLYERF